jgi:hypothetical protein
MGWAFWIVAVGGAAALTGLVVTHQVAAWRLSAWRDEQRRAQQTLGRSLAQAVTAGWGNPLEEFPNRVCTELVPVLLRYPGRSARLFSTAGDELRGTTLPLAIDDPGKTDPSLLGLAFGELGFLRSGTEPRQRVVAVANLAAIALAARFALAESDAENADRRQLLDFADRAIAAINSILPVANARRPKEDWEEDRTLADQATEYALQVVPDDGHDNSRHTSRVVTVLGLSYRLALDEEPSPALVSLAPRRQTGPVRPAWSERLVPLPDAQTPGFTWPMAALPGACAVLYLGLIILAATR